jgi:protein-S-isoprenylcysteine O-methyltransferase Ste14
MARRSIARLQGSRGEGWVAAQTLLLLGSVAATFAGPVLPQSIRGPARLLGLAAIVGGGALFLAGALNLGENLTPLPRPKPAGTLVRTGAYRVVRHPIYGGVILAGVGWALFRGRWLGLAVSTSLLPFFDAKANLEETWLTERFPDYPAYRRRVRKLLPGVY